MIPSASAASVPGRMISTSSDWAAASVRRTSIVTTCAPRRRAFTRWGAVLGWLARLAPHSTIRLPVVVAHVLLGIGLERAGEPDAEAAEAPADHGGRPPLAAPQVGEPPQQLRVHSRAVVGGEEAVSRPEPDRLAPHRLHALGDAIERLVPGDRGE